MKIQSLMMKKGLGCRLSGFALAAFALAGLAACGSSVKLDQPAPIENRSGAGVSAGGTAGAAAGSGAQTAVAPVDVTKPQDSGTGPAGVGKSVYFDFDSFVIKDDYKPLIDSHSKYMRNANGRKVFLEGNTDERGGSEYNLALGQKRADAVRRALVLLGVPDNQLEATSFGKEKPKAQGSSEAAWAENRRVDFNYR